MSVRKRTWSNKDGEQEAWIVDYVDQTGARAIKTFRKKKEADAYHDSVRTDVRAGVHVAPNKVTVSEAGELWIKECEADKLERTTVDQYRQHLRHHITPLLGQRRLADLDTQAVRDFEDKLKLDRSPAMVRKVLVSLSSILSDAVDRKLVARNVVRERGRHRRGKGTKKGKSANLRSAQTFRRRRRLASL